MLRRYVVVNGISTVLMYGAFWALAPSLSSVAQSLRQGFDSYAMESVVLGPILYRMVTVSGR